MLLSPSIDSGHPLITEREIIGQRTRDALAAKRAQGVRLGRPRQLPGDVVTRIRSLRDDGRTMQAIADTLTDEGVSTARGGERWCKSSVQRVLDTVSRSPLV